ncbi:MAG: hypothetical protein ABI594_02365 [Ginsengibacter sp.]
MNRKTLAFLFFIFICFSASAQKDKLKFHSVNAIGITAGESGGHPILQTINGLGNKEWFAGIGFGVDYYRYKTFPLFFDARKNFGNKNKWFVYGDLGYNFPGKNVPGKEIYYYNSYHFSGGVHGDLGLGYRISFSEKSALLFSTGYTYKKIQNKVGVVNPCLIAPCPVDYSNYEYGYGRIVLKAGVDF